jgi:hypothetical protein
MKTRVSIALFLPVMACSDHSSLEFSVRAASGSGCPAPTVRAADGSCTLERDTRLTATLELGDGVTLDCGNRRLLPEAPGSGRTAADFVPSRPEVAVVITGHGATVRRCGIGTTEEPFDFSVLVTGGAGNRVADNTLRTRTYGVKVLASHDNVLEGNDVVAEGFGFSIQRNADRNVVRDNRVRTLGVGPTPFLREDPGSRYRTGSARTGVNVLNPVFNRPVNTLVINGAVRQFPSTDGSFDQACEAACPGYGRAEDNVIEGNRIWIPGEAPLDNTRIGLVAATMTSDTTFRDNYIEGGAHGIRMAGGNIDERVRRPARCLDDAGQETDRWCETGAECFIAGVDAQPVGTCPALVIDVVDGRARDTLAEGNSLQGPFNDGRPEFRAAIVGGNQTLRGVIRGNSVAGTGIEAGITLATFMLETGTVEGNRVHGAAHALLLHKQAARFFGARVSANDFVGSTIAGVGAVSGYDLVTELSVDGAGSYWGHEEEPCFRDSDSFDPALVRDSHASCGSVAR